MKTIRFGVIGCGLMGKEFASAAARWCHLTEMNIRPQIVAACDTNDAILEWWKKNLPSETMFTRDYRELLTAEDVDAVYCAVPHNLHRQIYCDILESGKHLLAEKPFGIDKPANDAILECCSRHPDLLVRCSSQMPFFPAVQRIGRMIEAGAFERVIEVNASFLHSSDLNPDKPINWKRKIEFNGEYGCMGDLGMHVCHVPLRAGWNVRNVRAVLSNIFAERPDGKGSTAPCGTWDNATLLCETEDGEGHPFPMTLKTQRVAPGEKNSWSIEIKGTRACARFSTKNPKRLELLEYSGGEQVWQQIDMGAETSFPVITGGIFEFGFSDAILQMWAAFLYELDNGKPLSRFSGCATPEETALSHRIFTAALASQKDSTVEAV